MRYRKLGRTGLRVSEVGLGSTTFVGQVEEREAARIVDRAWDGGVNLFDTADVYGGVGGAETILGHALKGKRPEAIIATKVFGKTGPQPNDQGLSRGHIMAAVEASLRRLQTDYLDLYQMHQWDSETPLEESLRAMDDLVRQGKVRYVGCSNFAAWQVCKGLWTSSAQNLNRFESVQSRYNLLSREVELELAPLCLAEGVGMIVYNPIAGGLLTGKYDKDEPPPAGTRFSVRPWYRDTYWSTESFAAIDRLKEVARRYGRTPIQLALGWLLSKPVVSSAIVSATVASQLDETLSIADLQLSPEEVAACAAAVEPEGR